MPLNLARLVLVVALLVPLVSACAAPTGTVDRGLAHYREGNYQAALVTFDDAVRQAPRDAATWNNRGLARLRLGQTVAALGDLTKAIELSPADPELHFNRGNVYMTLGIDDHAIQDYNRAVALAPGYAKAYFNRGMARLRAGDRPGAEADWRYAIAFEPDATSQAAMIRTAGLGTPPARVSVAAAAGTAPAPTAVPGAPAPTVPPPTAESSLSAMPAFGERLVPPDSVDARVLTLRAMSRELDGDRAGAIADLRQALTKEQDPAQRAVIERFLRSVEGVR
jgi:Flp pilus assembly protein TadD